MTLADFPAIAALSVEEKLHLIDDLWNSMKRHEVDNFGVTDEEKEALDSRWAEYERNPSSAMSL